MRGGSHGFAIAVEASTRRDRSAIAWPVLSRLALLVAPLFLLPGCLEKQCDRHRGEPLVYRGGNTSESGGFYETNALDEPFLHFPAGRSYEIVHGLRERPTAFHAYLAFGECPLSASVRNPGGSPSCEPVGAESGGGGFAEGSGNEAMFEVRDDETLIVRNDTCAEFYLRVVATTFLDEAVAEPSDSPAPELADDAGAPDAGR